jgi:molecular chaperone IbpA
MNTLTWDFTNPFFIGWDNFNSRIETTFKENLGTTFPPYNVKKLDEDRFVVELAVAGYNKSTIKVSEHDGALIVEGEKPEESEEYLYKGISSKKFRRSFSLGEHVHISEVHMQDGILYVALNREIPEEKKPKTFQIKNFSDKKEK